MHPICRRLSLFASPFLLVATLVSAQEAERRVLSLRPSTARPVAVVDNDGRPVGALLGTTTAVRQIGGEWVAFVVGPNGIGASNLDFFLYASADCSGQAYTLDPLGTAFHGFFGYATSFGDTLYYGLASEAHDVIAHSSRSVSDGPNGPCFEWQDVNQRSPRAPIHTLTVSFSTPFHLTQ